MHSKLFDSIIRDDLASQPFDEFNGVGTPLLHEFCEFERIFEQALIEGKVSYYQNWAIFKADEKTRQYFFIQNTTGSLTDVYYTWSTDQKFADPSFVIAPVSKTNKYLITNEQEASQAAAQVTEYALTLTKKIQRGTQITPKTYMNSWGPGLGDRQQQKHDNLIKDKPLTPSGG